MNIEGLSFEILLEVVSLRDNSPRKVAVQEVPLKGDRMCDDILESSFAPGMVANLQIGVDNLITVSADSTSSPTLLTPYHDATTID